MIERLQHFILELGYGFCFVGRQYRLALGRKEYFVDLLFYHRFLKALVAFDLKIGSFEPEHAGKMDFYLNLLNEKERAPGDQPSIGIILCAEKDDIEVEFALKTKTNPIGVAEYQTPSQAPCGVQGPTAHGEAACRRRARSAPAPEIIMAKKQNTKTVVTLKHDEATRKNIPTAEYQSVMQKDEQSPVRVAYERRNRDLDPQLVWRGKDEQDWSDLVVHAPPLYIQEKVHPKVLIDDLLRETKERRHDTEQQLDLFADFNGIPKGVDKTEFYQHDQNWSNRMILGDSLQVMASLAEREGLRGKVQCIYLDPPYGIKFNSNFQWSTTSRDVKDGNVGHITREPEQVKAFRDTWRDGIHSYLTYLRDRLTVARDLLTDSGSIFVQIGDENVHRVRALMDEVFGDDNFCRSDHFSENSGLSDRSP